MIVKAAVLRKVNEPYSIEELELAPPKEKEALVRYVYTGYCHSDLSNMLGHVSMALPLVAGHEAAGIVEEVGPGQRVDPRLPVYDSQMSPFFNKRSKSLFTFA
jgi:Zn-dependent alcohol dehydrogenase